MTEVFIGALTAVLVAFKIVGLYTGTWWWVFSPVWIYVSIYFIIVFISTLISELRRWYKNGKK